MFDAHRFQVLVLGLAALALFLPIFVPSFGVPPRPYVKVGSASPHFVRCCQEAGLQCLVSRRRAWHRRGVPLVAAVFALAKDLDLDRFIPAAIKNN